MEEFFLSGLFTCDELNIVNKKNIAVPVFVMNLLHILRFDSFNDKAYKFFAFGEDNVNVGIVSLNFITDSTEGNTNVMPYVLAQGDNYYLHQNKVFGSYIADQWREISGTGGNKVTDASISNKADPTSKK